MGSPNPTARYPELIEGTLIRGPDGERLGKVVFCGDEYFVVERGRFFPKDFTVSYDEIVDFRHGDAYISRHRQDLLPLQEAQRQPGWIDAAEEESARAAAFGQIRGEPREKT